MSKVVKSVPLSRKPKPAVAPAVPKEKEEMDDAAAERNAEIDRMFEEEVAPVIIEEEEEEDPAVATAHAELHEEEEIEEEEEEEKPENVFDQGEEDNDEEPKLTGKSEKQKYQELAKFHSKKSVVPKKVAVAPSKKVAVVPKAVTTAVKPATTKVLPFFPHKDDLFRLSNFVKVSVSSIFKQGLTEDDPRKADFPDDDPEMPQRMSDFMAFTTRCFIFGKQVLAGFKELCANNPHMSSILGAFGSCKLVFFGTSKPLFPLTKTEQESGIVPAPKCMCVWTGNEIANPLLVKAVALVPRNLEKSSPVMFHIEAKYLAVLRCLHTVVSFTEYLAAEIQGKYETLPPLTEDQDWRSFFGEDTQEGEDGKKPKKKPFVLLAEQAQSQLIECSKTLQTVLNAEKYFVVKTPAEKKK